MCSHRPIWINWGKMIAGKKKLSEPLIKAFIMGKGTNAFYPEAPEKALSAESKKMFKRLVEAKLA